MEPSVEENTLFGGQAPLKMRDNHSLTFHVDHQFGHPAPFAFTSASPSLAPFDFQMSQLSQVLTHAGTSAIQSIPSSL